MNIYCIGIGGVGIGPIAQIAKSANYHVSGSDLRESLTTKRLEKESIHIFYNQSGEALKKEHQKNKIDWVIHSSAIPSDHPELNLAKTLGIKTSKRDEFLNYFINQKNLKLVAVSGTHGKTKVTSMLSWLLHQLDLPISHNVGTTLSWEDSGKYDPKSNFFIYECDEFDRNFLHFSPFLSLLVSIDHDHQDIYPTTKDYFDAFLQFFNQSENNIIYRHDIQKFQTTPVNTLALDNKNLSYILNSKDSIWNQNANLVFNAVKKLGVDISPKEAFEILVKMPSSERRFEKLKENLYTDYAHHPVEISAVLEEAKMISDKIAVIYQPHQNMRQIFLHQQNLYEKCFDGIEKLIWLPTYLSRENPDLEILTNAELLSKVKTPVDKNISDLNNHLKEEIAQLLNDGYLVLCLSAGDLDTWLRKEI